MSRAPTERRSMVAALRRDSGVAPPGAPKLIPSSETHAHALHPITDRHRNPRSGAVFKLHFSVPFLIARQPGDAGRRAQYERATGVMDRECSAERQRECDSAVNGRIKPRHTYPSPREPAIPPNDRISHHYTVHLVRKTQIGLVQGRQGVYHL